MHLLFGNQANYANNEIKQKIKQKTLIRKYMFALSIDNIEIYVILTSIEQQIESYNIN